MNQKISYGGISQEKWKEYNNNPLNPLLNRNIQGLYSLASTFKMVMGLAALTEGKTTISERIYDSGIYPKAHKPKCWIYGVSGGGHRMAKCNKCIKKFM